ncbi:Pyrrolo-quinoline quinone [Pirellula staleyi DSM 6068]|uniref:Pyrrolo-quinoline quinone n=1 Tax=Pirellula staleyi (strain ATCC 27377 / DSM 6068 / ICPB 4128) TaxID=530564 RepID=D2R4K3_PIRSD|nr:Pyrrolo-quinoline quinone [Pirellula staleyi DSM 6068]
MQLLTTYHVIRQQFLTTSFTLLAIVFIHSSAMAENWPQWRGPEGTGVSSERELPIVWSEKRGIAWKTAIPASGASTPVIWGDAIFLTSHTQDQQLMVLKLSKKTGEIEWQKSVGTGEAARQSEMRKEQKFHDLHNLASPSCVTDGKTVVAHFGNGLLVALDFEGNELWKHNLAEAYGNYTIWWGHANSPVIASGLVINVCMQDSRSDLQSEPVESYVVAHDLVTGKLRWKKPRMTAAKSEQCDSYTTPLLTKIGGLQQLVVMGGNQLDAYDPVSGNQIWMLDGLVGGRTVTGPTIAGDMIITTRGMRGPMIAVRPTGTGEQNHRAVLWSYTEGTPDSCTPVVARELIYSVTDDGILRCIDLASGNLKFKERIAGKYKASPITAEGRVFLLNTDGRCTVISATPRFDKLVENQLEGETIASPATSDGRIYIRSKTHLYCISR